MADIKHVLTVEANIFRADGTLKETETVITEMTEQEYRKAGGN